MRHFEDGIEVQEAQKRRIELVEPREEAPVAPESPEQPFDLVPELAGFPVVGRLPISLEGEGRSAALSVILSL